MDFKLGDMLVLNKSIYNEITGYREDLIIVPVVRRKNGISVLVAIISDDKDIGWYDNNIEDSFVNDDEYEVFDGINKYKYFWWTSVDIINKECVHKYDMEVEL